jgi:hypothetical protein
LQPLLPAKAIFTGIGVLLGVNVSSDSCSRVSCDTVSHRAAKDVATSHDTLVDLFERIQAFLTRLNIYSGISLTTDMITLLGKVMAEVLSILALSTKEIQQKRISEHILYEDAFWYSYRETEKFMKRLMGRTDVEDALRRLDRLTQEEMRTAVAKNLEVVHSIKDSTSKSAHRSTSR